MDAKTAASVLQTPIQSLIDFCKKEISQIRGLNKEAAKLAAILDTIQKFLNDAEARSIPGDAVKSWLKKLEDVVFDANNVLDELHYHLLSKQIEPTESMMEKVLTCCSSSFNSIARKRNMALRIKEINENLDCINKDAAVVGLKERLAADEPTLPDAPTFETDSVTLDPIFIGRDDVVSEIVKMLTNSITTDERRVSILPIVGMGGLGKTTLTRKVFNLLKNKNRFGLYIWVHVSPNFETITLLKKILNNLTSHQVENASREIVLTKLQEALKDKTYLLVLDDAWNEDLFKWNDFMNSFLGVGCVKGNAIVVTTRSMKVASIVNPIYTHELEGLSEEECWSIIKVKTFGEENVPSVFEAIGKKIASKCQGLPLAANVVGGTLSNQSEEKWRSIEEKWLSPDEGGDYITKILRLSFDNLSLPSLKKCFAYCAMFPKGSGIMKQELIEFWMAEGFLQADGRDGRDDMESVGEKFINVLLHNSLLQVSERDDYGDVKSCGMHDLVHDLACSVSSSSNSTCGSRVRYMSLEEESSPIPKEMAKSLRTLLMPFQGDSSGINFSDLESLHVLRLEYGVKELSSSIRKLIHLRYFDFSYIMIEYLPDWIGEFFHLQTLRVDSRWLKKLPSTIKYLINLRHLPNVRKLGITYFGGKLRENYQLHNLVFLHHLEKLKLVMEADYVFTRPVFPESLRKLTLSGCRFPWEFMDTVGSLPNLQVLKLRNDACRGRKWETKEDQFPSLEFLEIDKCNLKKWVTEGSHFPRLKCLVLFDCSQLSNIPSDIGDIPTLELINVDYANKSLVECVKRIQDEQRGHGNYALQVHCTHRPNWKTLMVLEAVMIAVNV